MKNIKNLDQYIESSARKRRIQTEKADILLLSVNNRAFLGAIFGVFAHEIFNIFTRSMMSSHLVSSEGGMPVLKDSWFNHIRQYGFFLFFTILLSYFFGRRAASNTYQTLRIEVKKDEAKLLRLAKKKRVQQEKTSLRWSLMAIPTGLWGGYEFLTRQQGVWAQIDKLAAETYLPLNKQIQLQLKLYNGRISIELSEKYQELISQGNELFTLLDKNRSFYLLPAFIAMGVVSVKVATIIYYYYKQNKMNKVRNRLGKQLTNFSLHSLEWKQIEDSNQFVVSTKGKNAELIISEAIALLKPNVVHRVRHQAVMEFSNPLENVEQLANRFSENIVIRSRIMEQAFKCLNFLSQKINNYTPWYFQIVHIAEHPYACFTISLSNSEYRKNLANELKKMLPIAKIGVVNSTVQVLLSAEAMHSVPNVESSLPPLLPYIAKSKSVQTKNSVTAEQYTSLSLPAALKHRRLTWIVEGIKLICVIDNKGECNSTVFPVFNGQAGRDFYFTISQALLDKLEIDDKNITQSEKRLLNSARNKRFVGATGVGYKYCAGEGIIGIRGGPALYKLKLLDSEWRLYAEAIGRSIGKEKEILFELNYLQKTAHR